MHDYEVRYESLGTRQTESRSIIVYKGMRDRLRVVPRFAIVVRLVSKTEIVKSC